MNLDFLELFGGFWSLQRYEYMVWGLKDASENPEIMKVRVLEFSNNEIEKHKFKLKRNNTMELVSISFP